MGKVTWHDKHNRGTKILFKLHYELEDLAIAFKVTGNEIMYKTLILMSSEALNAHSMVINAISESINESYKVSREHSNTILKSVLAGIEIKENNAH